MEIIKVATYEVHLADSCCGGAYNYDNDSNCIEDQ